MEDSLLKMIEKIREAISKLIIPESECKGKPLTDIGRQYAYREVLGIIESMSKEEPANEKLEVAKSGVGNNDNYIQFDDGTYIDLDPSMQLKPAFDVKEGDKVKVIIVKEK